MAPAHKKSRSQQGAITLVLVTSLVVIAIAATVSGGQRIWLDRLSTRNLYEREQAHWVADAGLQWAAQTLQTLHTDQHMMWPLAQQSPCPEALQGQGHQCLHWNAPPPEGLNPYILNVWAMRDVRQHPHVAQLLVQAEDPSTHAQAWLSRSLHLPVLGRAGANNAATVMLDACTNATPSWWTGLMGQLSTHQLQAWSALQQQWGLSNATSPPRSVYWVSTPGDWLLPLGSAQDPVLLVFDEQACTPHCPALQAPVHGTVCILPNVGKRL